MLMLVLVLPFASANDASVITYWLDNGQNAGAGARTVFEGETVNFKVYADPCYNYNDCRDMDLRGVILDENNNVVEELFNYNNLREVFGDDETSVFSFTPQTEGTYYVVVDTDGAQNAVCENENSCSVLELSVEEVPPVPEEIVWGCTDSTAINYDSGANRDNGFCNHNPRIVVMGPPAYDDVDGVYYYDGNIGREFYVRLRGLDQEQTDLTFAWNHAVNGEGSTPRGFTIENTDNSRNGYFRWTPTTTGTFAANIILNDGYGGQDTQIVVFTIGNHAPTLDVTPEPDMETINLWKYDVYTNEEIDLAITAHDVDNDELDMSIQWTNEYEHPGLDFSYGDDLINVQWTPEESGEYGFIVRVTDGKVFTEKTVVFNVLSPQLLVYPVQDYSLTEESNAVSFTLNTAQFNPFNDDVTYDVRVEREECTGFFCVPDRFRELFLPSEAEFDSETGEFTFTPTYDTVEHPDEHIEYTFKFRAQDGYQESEWVESTINIGDVNREPVVELLYPTTLLVGEEGSFGAIIVENDADGDDLRFIWNFDDMDDLFGQYVDYTFTVAGEHYGTLLVDDGFGDVLEFSFTVMVEEEPVIIVPVNHVPTIKGITDKEVMEGETLVLNIDARDEDNRDTLSYEMQLVGPVSEVMQSSGSFDSETGRFTFTPNFDFVAHPNLERSFDVEFRAVDNHGEATEWQDVTITVIDVNRNPEIIEFNVPTTVIIGEEFDVSGNAEDADNDDLTYEWIFANDVTTEKEGQEATHTFDHLGDFSVTLNVYDAFGGSDFQIVILTVENEPVCNPAEVDNANVAPYPECTVTCKKDFHMERGICVADPDPVPEVCDPAEVENGHVSSYPACGIMCDRGYYLEGTVCIETPVPEVCTPADVDNGDVSAYPECTITCDTDYHLEDNTCVQDIVPNVCTPAEVDNANVAPYPMCTVTCKKDFHMERGTCVADPDPVPEVCDPAEVANGHVSSYPTCGIMCDRGYYLEGTVCIETPVPEVCTPASVDNGDVSSYPKCTITCDVDYHVEGNVCVANPELENNVPVMEQLDNMEVYEGESISFNVEAEDADSDRLTYKVRVDGKLFSFILPSGASFNKATGEFTFSPDYDFVNHPDLEKDITLKFRAYDGEDWSEYMFVTITVLDVNRNPVITDVSVPSQLFVGEEGEFSVDANDADNDALQYRWNFGDNTKVLGENQEHAFDRVGTYTVTIIVKDDFGGRVVEQRTVRVAREPVCTPADVANGHVSSYPACTISCDTNYHVEGSVCVADPEPEVCTPASVDNGDVSSYPACTITCDTGYHKESNTCVADPVVVPGCTDPAALNYNAAATVSDNSCEYEVVVVLGCTDVEASNYNENANSDDNSCTYPVLRENFFISHAHPSQEVAMPGDIILFSIGVANNGDVEYEDLRVKVVSYDFGVMASSGNFDLDNDERTSEIVPFHVPYDAWPGQYTVKITAGNDYVRKTTYRMITIV